MKNDEIIRQAIKIHQGERLEVGTPCAHPSDKMTYHLKEYKGNMAVLEWNGVVKMFPASEIFDVNKVRDTAVRISFESSLKNIHGLN